MKFWPHVESKTLKILLWNLAHVITPGTSLHMQILGQIGSRKVLQKYVKYNTFIYIFIRQTAAHNYDSYLSLFFLNFL